ncbi:hypothetical protein SDC9_145321 [bioreactor metagenome]|uniref:Uncharacterized protein n=1 Tax=bioreactor metagenome TaxID=1076179 RepID=A0A645EAI2_9ZZZZ
MRLAQADDPVRTAVGSRIVHKALLLIHFSNGFKTLFVCNAQSIFTSFYLQPAQRFKVLSDIVQLFPDSAPGRFQFCLALLGHFEVVPPGFPAVIRGLVPCLATELPQLLNELLRVLTAIIHQAQISRILDVRRSNRRVHDQDTLVPAAALRRFVLVVRLVFVSRMRPFIHELVDLLQHLGGEPFAKVHHHGRIEQRFLAERLQAHQILRVGVLAQIGDCPFIRQVLLFLNE